MTEFCLDKNCEEIPDPYFSGEEGFEIVLDILEDATKGLLNFLLKDFNES
jgi:protein-tyrosine phosphatase